MQNTVQQLRLARLCNRKTSSSQSFMSKLEDLWNNSAGARVKGQPGVGEEAESV